MKSFLRAFPDSYTKHTDPVAVAKNLRAISQKKLVQDLQKLTIRSLPLGRNGKRTYPIAPSDMSNVFLAENLCRIAFTTEKALLTKTPRSTDVRAYLRHELETAFDLMAAHPGPDLLPPRPKFPPVRQGPLFNVGFIEEITQRVQQREFEGPAGYLPANLSGELNEGNALIVSHEVVPYDVAPYNRLISELPGNLEQRAIGALCWAIAVDAGLLNRRLHEDMARLSGTEGYSCPHNLDGMAFYVPAPSPDMDLAFKNYVRSRWPMIVFALDPVTDQQNIDDAYSLRRDLQLALSFAFATGRVNFNQFTQYSRKVAVDSEALALNRTVTTFAHGNDAFGWRFAPRFQNPPLERNNIQAVANLIYRNGPGRNYQIKNSKLEAGQRELTAVVIMPSFLERVRFDTSSNWWRLHDAGRPDELKLHTAHMLEQGRKVIEVRQSLAQACDSGRYRPNDFSGLVSRVDQLEAMLPMQSKAVNVPFENALGGFELFTQGATSLTPELVGYEGIDSVGEGNEGDVIVFGKGFSVVETKVVAGGQNVVAAGPTVPAATATFDIVSREIMRVHIPKEARSTIVKKGDGDEPFIEVRIATPNGISNALLIPFKPTPKADTPAPTYGWSIVEPSINIAYKVQVPSKGEPTFTFDPDKSDSDLHITLNEPVGIVPSAIKATFSFQVADNLNVVDLEQSLALTRGKYPVDVEALANDLSDKLTAKVLYPAGGPLKAVVTKTVKASPVIQAMDPNFTGIAKKTANALTVNFTFSLNGTGVGSTAPATPAPPMPGAAAAPANPAAPAPLPNVPPPAPAPSPPGSAKTDARFLKPTPVSSALGGLPTVRSVTTTNATRGPSDPAVGRAASRRVVTPARSASLSVPSR